MARRGWRREYVLEFSTPQRLTVMGRELNVVEFRTPQHPSTGTNHWGGGSPLLSPNIPRESLSASYLRFNAIDITGGDADNHAAPRRCTAVHPSSPAERARGEGGGERRRSAGASKWRLWWKKGGERVFGWNDVKKRKEKEKEKEKKSCRWSLGDHRSRWPQGWC